VNDRQFSQRFFGGDIRFCQLANCKYTVNPLNVELNPICHLLALLGAHHIFHVSGLSVKSCSFILFGLLTPETEGVTVFRNVGKNLTIDTLKIMRSVDIEKLVKEAFGSYRLRNHT